MGYCAVQTDRLTKGEGWDEYIRRPLFKIRQKETGFSKRTNASSLASKKDFIADSVVSRSKVTAGATSERVVSFYIHHLATEGAGKT